MHPTASQGPEGPASQFTGWDSLVTPTDHLIYVRALHIWFSQMPARDYVVDDFGSLQELSAAATQANLYVHNTRRTLHGQAEQDFLDACERFDRARADVAKAERALAAMVAELAHTLPPGVAQ